MDKITPTDLQGMVAHWIDTPPNAYLGSDYGSPIKQILQTPLKSGLADALLNKLRVDIPLAGALPPQALNMYAIDEGPDKKRIFIDAAGQMVALGAP